MPLKVLNRYIAREILHTQFAVIVVLILIILGGVLARLLGEVAEGRIPADVLPQILVLGSISALILLLPVSLFLSVMLALGRLYKDSEMAALGACGVGTGMLLRVVLAIALPLSLVLGVLTLVVMPDVNARVEQIRAEALARTDLAGIVPGRFTRAGFGGDTVFFVESLSEDRQRMRNVFIERRVGEQTEVVVAAAGERLVDPATGDSFLVLHDGYRYEGNPGEADFRIMHFRSQGLRIPDAPELSSRVRMKSKTTAELLDTPFPAFKAELQWRLAAPVSLLVLAFLAVPLSHTSPRKGRYSRLALGIVVYVVYAQLQFSARAWMVDGVTPSWLGMWWVHILVALLAMGLLLRHSGMGWRMQGGRQGSPT